MKSIFIAGTLAALIGLGGCQKSESPAETQNDVSNAQISASKDIDAARADANAKVASATTDVNASQAALDHETALADQNVAMTAAKGAHQVALAKCDALSGDDRTVCKRQADADLASAEARAGQQRAANDPKP